MRQSLIVCVCVCISVVLLSACGGGSGGGSTDLTENVGLPLSKFVVVDLSTGAITAHSDLSDLLTNDIYKTTHMVFRTIDAGSTYYGSSVADLGHQADEIEGTASLSKFFIGVFEVTQEQWLRISGLQPWTSIDSTALDLPGWTVVDSKSPACALSYAAISTGLTLFNSSKAISLSLPSDLQWEFACRAGSNNIFSWGSSTQTAVAGLYAVTRETTGGVGGSLEVGLQTANTHDMYDMHGNVWEMTAEKNIRGGSWFDNVLMSRAANKQSILEEIEHNLVGVRLVFVP